MSEKDAIQKYKVEGRQALVARVAKGASTAIDTLIAASESGDVRASEIILKKVLPDLKAVDISHSGEGVKIVINQKIFNRGKKETETIEMPAVNINISRDKKAPEYQEIDITESVTVSQPPEQGGHNHAVDRKKGVFR
jgi:hypothetical protein